MHRVAVRPWGENVALLPSWAGSECFSFPFSYAMQSCESGNLLDLWDCNSSCFATGYWEESRHVHGMDLDGLHDWFFRMSPVQFIPEVQ